jgi:hypothetical protein
MDITGRLLLAQKVQELLPLPALQPGIYLLRIKDENQRQVVKKIVIE